MRRDWYTVQLLLDVSERLVGHPNLKGLRDDALADMVELAAEPPSLPAIPERTTDVLQEIDPEAETLGVDPQIVRRKV